MQNWTFGAAAGLLMGTFSYVSNAAMYKGFAIGKTSLMAIATSLPPVVVIVSAYLLWGEKLSWGQGGAFVVILVGILMMRYSGGFSIANLSGLKWAVITLIGFGFTEVSTKQSTLWEGQIFPTLTVMFAVGSLLFYVSWQKQLKKNRSQDSITRLITSVKIWSFPLTMLWGMLVGLTNISGMVFMLMALKLGVTGLVSAIIATNVLLILLYARIFLKENFSRLEVGGMICTFAGVVSLRL